MLIIIDMIIGVPEFAHEEDLGVVISESLIGERFTTCKVATTECAGASSMPCA